MKEARNGSKNRFVKFSQKLMLGIVSGFLHEVTIAKDLKLKFR